MASKYTIILKSLNFLSVSDCEQRTAVHTSIFTGHEKHYRFLLNNLHFEFVWRKGIENTYKELDDVSPSVESKERVDYLKIYQFGKLVDYGLLEPDLEEFCLKLEKLLFNENYEIAVPRSIEKLLRISSAL